MPNEISLIGSGDKLALPAHLQAAFGSAPSNIITEGARNTLGIRAKKFTITVGGESQVLQRKDPDTGDMVPVGGLAVVIMDYAVKTGRSYYDSAFDPDVQSQPTCWSLDGVVPEPEVAEKQHPRCAGCPQSVKGSKMGDNDNPLVACAVHRILSVIPVKKLDLPPLQLRIAQTSDYDGKNPEAKGQGYFAFKQYLEALKSRGIPSTRAIVTNLSFDNSIRVSYPKLFFRASRWLEADEHAKVQAIVDSGKVREMLTWTGTEAQLAGENHRPDVDPAVVAASQVKHQERSGGAQDGRFADAEASLGAKVEQPKAEPAKRTRQTAATKAAEQPKAEPAKAASAEFSFRAMEDGEDEDDYAIAKAQARKAWVKTQAAPAKPAEFVPPQRQDGEDEDDYAIRVAQARKKHKTANGGAPATASARPQVQAEEVPAGEEKPSSAFAGMDLGDEDAGPTMQASAPATASAEPPKSTKSRGGKPAPARGPVEAVQAQKVPDAVDAILGEWE